MTDVSNQLPQDIQDLLTEARKQWSQLVAWSWSSKLAFENDYALAEEETKLKEFFSKILQDQAKYRHAVVVYHDVNSIELANQSSEIIKRLFTGQPQDELKLTLSEVLVKLNGRKFICTQYPQLFDIFTYVVVVDKFVGNILNDENKPGSYIVELSYPPSPSFGQATFTEELLNSWIQDSTSGEYIPPSAYIPFGGS